MRVFGLAVGLAVILLASQPALAQDFLSASRDGKAANALVKVGRASVTLPPGNWQEIGTDEFSGTSAGSASTETLTSKAFAEYSDNKTNGIVVISSNNAQPAGKWLAGSFCTRTDTIAIDNVSTDSRTFDCLQINHLITADPALNKGIEKVVSTAAIAHGGLPTTWLVATIRMAGQTPKDVLTVFIYRDVRRDGFNDPKVAWNLSPWHRSNITPDRMKVVERLMAYAKAYRVTLRHEFSE